MRYARVGLSLGLALIVSVAAGSCAGSERSIILATTTSTYDSGLLDPLAERFKQETGVTVKIIAVGSGAALEMAARGDADAVLSHAPGAEKQYVESEDLAYGQLVMHNDFIILGPSDDPAGVKFAGTLAEALGAIALTGPFISRGDDSGTHNKELELWQAAGIDPDTVRQREETGQGMGASLNIADQKRAYILADRGTYLALRQNLSLEVLYEGDGRLLNIYHVYVVNPARHRKVKGEQARAFVDFLVKPETQAFIGQFGVDRYGEALFTPDAGKDAESLSSGR
jgi:tungstate transport system substrate-binding protein